MSTVPRVSVVLPVYNGAAYVVEAVESVLSQTFHDFELVIIDDGSTDTTRELLAPLANRDNRLSIRVEPRRGLVGSLNFGISIARAPLIARMDADDAALPSRFAAQVAYLDAHPDCVAVGTSILKVDAQGRSKSSPLRQTPRFDPLAFPPEIGGIPHPTAMMRRSAVVDIGGYRPHFYNAEDRDLWARLWQVGRIHQLPEVGLHYRVHAGSVTRLKQGEQLLSHMLADMAAVAHALGLDDSALLRRSLETGDKQAALDDYASLIGASYPVATYRMIHCIRSRMWRLAPFKSRRDMLMRAGRHVLAQPLDRNRQKLLWALVRHGPALQRLR
jgi:glycosyltransferase involved in cell wall biosynthesis